MKCHDPGVLGKAAHDVVDGGLIDAAHRGELVDGDPALLTELADAADIQIGLFHGGLLSLPVFGLLR